MRLQGKGNFIKNYQTYFLKTICQTLNLYTGHKIPPQKNVLNEKTKQNKTQQQQLNNSQTCLGQTFHVQNVKGNSLEIYTNTINNDYFYLD